MSGQQHAPAALYPRERPGTYFTGGSLYNVPNQKGHRTHHTGVWADPEAGGKEKDSASDVNLTLVIKPATTQKATYSTSHGGRYSVVAVVPCYRLEGSAFEEALGPTQPFVQGVPVLFSVGGCGKGVALTTHHHLVTRLRMNRAIPLLPTCAAWFSPSSPYTYEEFAPVNTMKAYEESRITHPLTITLITKCR